MNGRLKIALASLALLVGCQMKWFTTYSQNTASTTIPGGSADVPLSSDSALADLAGVTTTAEILKNVEEGDIRGVTFEELELRALEPDGADLSFIDSLELYATAPGLPRMRIASQDAFPVGEARVNLDLDDVDLTDYVLTGELLIEPEADGHLPPETTTVELFFDLAIGVTGKGCNKRVNP